MKFMAVFLFMAGLQVSARGVSQITISENNVPLQKVFQEIQKQSGYDVICTYDILTRFNDVTVNVRNASLQEALDASLKGKPLTYTIISKTVVVKSKLESFVPEIGGIHARQNLEIRSRVVIPPVKIQGTVRDEKGNPLSGVSVVLRGTNVGTTTAEDGRYSLDIPSNAGTLVFSSVGFITKEVQMGKNLLVDIILETDVGNLEQVVVTALGISREERSLSYNVQNINSEEFTKVKETNPINALQGKVAGLVITKSRNDLGDDSKVLLRGNRSLSGNNDPLYIIDGVPAGGTAGINMLNPDDIESITVLKGASAAALYGSAGQNGAILFTTKSGKAGPVVVEYDGGITFDQVTLLPKYQDKYGQGEGGIFVPNSEHSWGALLDGHSVELYNGHTVPYSSADPDNRLKDFFRIGKTMTNSIGLRGGTDKLNAYFSYNNTQQWGVMRNAFMDRHNVNLKIQSNISSRLSFVTSVSYIYEDLVNRRSFGKPANVFSGYSLTSMLRAPVSIPLSEIQQFSYTDASGNERESYWKPGSSVLLNPYWNMYRTGNKLNRDRLRGMFTAKYIFTDWLNLQVRGSLAKEFNHDESKTSNDTYYSLVGSDYYYFDNRNQTTNIDALLSFDRDLSQDFNLGVNLGASSQTGNQKASTTAAMGLNVQNFFFMVNARNPSVINNYAKSPLVNSLYGTANVGYKNFLYLDGTARNDWSSALPIEHWSVFYPSVGVSWIPSSMMRMPSWISFGKVRLSYAESGFGGNAYLTRDYYSIGTGGQVITPNIHSLGNYKPEMTSSYELGLEWRFLKNRFGFNLTYYNTKTENQLLLIGTPVASLFNQRYINAGLITNKGIELEVNVAPVRTKNFNWNMMLNYSLNRNKVVSLSEDLKSVILTNTNEATVRADEGGAFGDMYVKDWMKDDQGRRLVDDKGLPILTTGNTVLLGNYNPDFMMGLNNSIQYKSISLRFLIDYRKGGWIVDGRQAILDGDGSTEATLKGREGGLVLDAYTKSGHKNDVAIDPQIFYGLIGERYPTGGLYAYSATNVRLRELVLGYSIPERVIRNIKFIKRVDISLVGSNLFFFYLKAPVDPEITSGINGGGINGTFSESVSTRSIGVDLNISF